MYNKIELTLLACTIYDIVTIRKCVSKEINVIDLPKCWCVIIKYFNAFMKSYIIVTHLSVLK